MIIRKIKKYIRKVIFSYRLFCNTVFCKLHKKKFKYKIGIISCDKWLNKVKEDRLLCIELNKLFIYTSIISWESTKNIDDYDAIIIRSVWGYQDKIEEFNNWIKAIDNNKIIMLNDKDLILSNLNKYEQFKLLDKYNIPHVNTTFLDKNHLSEIKKLLKKSKEVVVKPIVSGSGNNTFIITNDNNKKNSISINTFLEIYNNLLNDINNYVMIQPFIKEIENGELSIIYIEGKISHAVIRMTNIFSDRSLIKIIPISSIDSKVIEICEKIIKIEEYNNFMFMRIDFVKVKCDYKIMEVELVDPQLFLEYRPTRMCLKKFSSSINERLEKQKK